MIRLTSTIAAMSLATCMMFGEDAAAQPAEAAPPATEATGEALQVPLPEDQLKAIVGGLREGKIINLLTAASNGDATQLKALWGMVQMAPPDEQSDAMFNHQWQMITAEGAEQILLEQIKPFLAQANGDVLAGQIGMGMVMIGAQIQANPALAESKEVAMLMEMVPKVQEWVKAAGLDDPEKASAFVTKVVEGARSLELKDAAGMRALSFDDLMTKADLALAVTKDALTVYGVDIDGTMDGISVGDSVADADDPMKRTLPVTITMFGEEHTLDLALTNQGGMWVSDLAIAARQGAANAGQAMTDTEMPPGAE